MDKEKPDVVIRESSKITIGILVFIVGGVFWLSTLYGMTIENSNDIRDLKEYIFKKLDNIEAKIEKIHDKLHHKGR